MLISSPDGPHWLLVSGYDLYETIQAISPEQSVPAQFMAEKTKETMIITADIVLNCPLLL